MIIGFETDFLKGELLIQAYKKAQLLINQHSESPQSLTAPEFRERQDEISFFDFVPGILCRFFESTNHGPITDEYFENFLLNIEQNVQESMHIDSVYYFHFDFLLANEQVLDRADFDEYTRRFHEVFRQITGTTIVSFSDFYDRYIHNQFFNAKALSELEFARSCHYTYVMYSDYENHDLSNFGPSFMSSFVAFSRDYVELHNDLEATLLRKVNQICINSRHPK